MRELAWPSMLLALSAALTLACSGAPSTPAQPDPARVLHDSGQSMAALKSVKADMKFGPGITLEGFTLSSANSTVQLPDQSDTTFKVKQGDFLVDVRVVTSGGHVYLRLPFSRFSELTPEQAAEIPDLTRLFDPQTGLASILAAGRSPSYQGAEKVANTECDRVTATYSAEQVGQLLGVKPAGDVRATIWAGQADHMVRRVILSGPLLQAGKDVQVQVDLHDFNLPVTVTPPPAAGPAPVGPAPAASPSPPG